MPGGGGQGLEYTRRWWAGIRIHTPGSGGQGSEYAGRIRVCQGVVGRD